MKTEELRLTYRDYLILSQNRGRECYEIIEGELYMTPSPSLIHQRISRKIEERLSRFVTERDLGEVFDAPLDVILSPYDVVQPDIIFVSKENSHILTDDNIQGSPDLLIEILSPPTQDIDMDIKKRVYAIYGVKEYWIVDPINRECEVYYLGEQGFVLMGRFEEGDRLKSIILNGFELGLDLIF